jgi:hypothetical protein
MDSFGQPSILMNAVISNDPGYFGERLTSARRRLANAWRERASQIEPTARKTDILGAALLASELFGRGQSTRRVLIFFSDMRNTTDGLNLEATHLVDPREALAKAERQDLVPDLNGAAVYVLGADAGEASKQRWFRVKQFWAGYFEKAGATLVRYSPTTEIPDLQR